jgi:hypothetical protein
MPLNRSLQTMITLVDDDLNREQVSRVKRNELFLKVITPDFIRLREGQDTRLRASPLVSLLIESIKG